MISTHLGLIGRPCSTYKFFRPLSVQRYYPQTTTVSRPRACFFATSPRHRKEERRIPQTLQQDARPRKDQDTESVKPETVQKEKPADTAAGQDPLLAEKTVSDKEQRKADWAIIKEMSKYLWPKDNLGTRFRVGASVALLISAKV